MARKVLLDSADDIKWLRDVHLPKLTKQAKSAMVYGNEDCPDRVDVYRQRSPKMTDKPRIFIRKRGCTLIRKR